MTRSKNSGKENGGRGGTTRGAEEGMAGGRALFLRRDPKTCEERRIWAVKRVGELMKRC